MKIIGKAGCPSLRRVVLGGLAGFVLMLPGVEAAQAEEAPSRARLWEIIQEQARQIELLQRQQRQTDEQVEATGQAVERFGSQSAQPGWWQRTSIGGYGELHYAGGQKDEVDFHRFVLFVGHEFTDSIRLFTELEVEHVLVGEGKPGEVELEQAYVQFDLTDTLQLNTGLFLIPVGILNETHEPNTFFGVERNVVEGEIIPTTWWEAAIGIHGEVPETGFDYDLVLHSGLNVPRMGGNAFRIRSGRGKVAEASAGAGAITGRLRYTGFRGVVLGVTTQYQFDITQGNGDPMTGDSVPAVLLVPYIDARYRGFGFRALYGRWWMLDGATPSLLGRDEQYGLYVEPSYRQPLRIFGNDLGEIGVFFRFSRLDTAAGDNVASGQNRYTFGVNYWPHPNIVFKADFWHERRDNGTNEDRFNLGVGFQF